MRKAYWRRLEQYERAALTSASVIRDAYGAGVLYGVVAYRHSEALKGFAQPRSRLLARVEYIVPKHKLLESSCFLEGDSLMFKDVTTSFNLQYANPARLPDITSQRTMHQRHSHHLI